jgi:hypothetical protein
MDLFKKLFLFITLLFIANSCQYFESKVPVKEDLLNKELRAINWNEVDEYPSVQDCELLEDKNEQKQCFFDFLSAQIQTKLSIDTLSILYPELDTIEVKVTVFADSKLLFEPQFPKDAMAFDGVKIDSILKSRLVDFPKINPATKRGLPVKTQFILPVILKFDR